MIKVKICGTTNLEDALAAANAGADYLGFIFYPPSKRAVNPLVAEQIAAHLRTRPSCPVLVGVFVNETPQQMAQILERCQLDLAQLHGDEPPWLVADERSPLLGRAFKALRPTSLAEAEAEAEWYFPSWYTPQPHPAALAPSLLLDAHHPTLRGGSGVTAEWGIAARLAQQYPGVMLAGGLTAENVAEAVRLVRPFAVDVASGVETTPGKKDHALVQTFITNARQAHC